MTYSVITHSVRAYSVMTYSVITHSVRTYSVITHSVMTYSVITHSVRTYSVMTYSVITHSVRTYSVITHSVITYSVRTYSNITHSVYSGYNVFGCHVLLVITYSFYGLSIQIILAVTKFVGIFGFFSLQVRHTSLCYLRSCFYYQN